LLKEMYYLIRHTSLTFEDSVLLPVPVRRFFIESVVEDLKFEAKKEAAYAKSLRTKRT